MSEGYQI